jgi:hypothetical protein
LCLILALVGVIPARAMSLGPESMEGASGERLEVQLDRFEKGNAWWVNLGLPAEFLSPVYLESETPLVLSLKGVEYRLGISAWVSERFRARMTLPVESNRYVDLFAAAHNTVRPGDLQAGLSFLLLGRRDSSFRAALDGAVVFPTGVSPFETSQPILATGFGVYRAVLGGWASQRVGRFSLFQWINYEKYGDAAFESLAGEAWAASRLRWPDRLRAGFGMEWCFFRRGPREAALTGRLRVHRWGDWVLEGEGFSGGTAVWAPSDRIIGSGVGLRVRADSMMSFEAHWDFSPVEWSAARARPDYGSTVTLSLRFHPLEGDGVR